MDSCPYCGRDLEAYQAECIRGIIQSVEDINKEKAALLRKILVLFEKEPPDKMLALLKYVLSTPSDNAVLKKALDNYHEKVHDGIASRAGFFRSLLAKVKHDFTTHQRHFEEF